MWRIVVVSAMLGLAIAGCSTDQPEVAQEPAEQITPVMVKAAEGPFDPESIPVQSQALALPYQQLGVLQYVEPFSPRAIDDDHIDDRLRTMAVQNWGNDVGAIVGVQTSLSTDANQVTVTAQVVKQTTDCAVCRHAAAAPSAP